MLKRSVVHAAAALSTAAALVFGAAPPAGATMATLRPAVVTVGARRPVCPARSTERRRCTYPVTQIQAQATLFEYLSGYGFVLAGRSPLRYEQGTAGMITAVAFAVCVGSPRYFVTTGYHFFVAPPNYRPATARLDSATPVVTVSC